MDSKAEFGRAEGQAMPPCEEWQPLRILAASGDEVPSADQLRLAEHLAACPACSAEFSREEELLSLLAAHRAEPDASLLASCRADLNDALDREEERGWLRRFLEAALTSSWLSPQPAWSAAVLLLIGFATGILGPSLLVQRAQRRLGSGAVASARVGHAAGNANAGPGAPADKSAPPASMANTPITALDLHSADVAGISVAPANAGEPPRVELHLRTMQPLTVQGTVDDGGVKDVLLYVLRHGSQFHTGVRLDAVGLLLPCSSEPEVRSALCHAAQADPSAAVRLQAIRSLEGAATQDSVRNTLVDALAADADAGVRLEAARILSSLAANGQVPGDDHLRAVLRDRMNRDPNADVRFESAAAYRSLVPGGKE